MKDVYHPNILIGGSRHGQGVNCPDPERAEEVKFDDGHTTYVRCTLTADDGTETVFWRHEGVKVVDAMKLIFAGLPRV